MQTTATSDIEAESGLLQHPDAKLFSLGRISACPICSYSLQGLPSRHRCPECGFEFDEHTLCFKPSGKWRFIIAFLAFMLFAGRISDVIRAKSGFGSWGWWLDVGIAAMWGLPILYYLLDWGERQHLIMRSSDILWKKRGDPDEKHEWKAVLSVSARTHEETVRLELGNGKSADIPRVFWPKTVKLREFARFIGSYRERMLCSHDQIKENETAK